MVLKLVENALNLGISTHSVLQWKRLAEIYENLFLPSAEKVREKYDYLIKIQSEKMRMTSNIRLFIFCMIWNISKCGDFTVL